MNKKHRPRSGSMQYWPRKRAKRVYARLRSLPNAPKPRLLGFPAYKAGMTHVQTTDARPMNKGLILSVAATVLECPPINVYGIRFLKSSVYGKKVVYDQLCEKPSPELGRKITLWKKNNTKEVKEYDDIKLLIHTNPKLTAIGKKRPEIFELGIGGNLNDKLAFAKTHLGKEIPFTEVFGEGEIVDLHGVTKGKGTQGPVKRFGIGLRNHKSEKTIRGPGSLGGWISQGHFMYRVAHAGKMGHHLRTHNNYLIMKIGNEGINPKGGFINYGNTKSTYVLIKGSVQGPKKSLVTLTVPMRPNKKRIIPKLQIKSISLESPQGR